MRIDEFDRPVPEAQLLDRLRNAEDTFVERKQACQPTKVRRTAVAFANSLPDGREGVIFVGVRDNGEPLPPGVFKTKPAEQKARDALGECYPKIQGVTYASLRVGDSEVLAVVIPASRVRPHFTGGAWVKNGATIEEASDEMLSQMIADRTEASRLLRRWVGQNVRYELEEQNYRSGRVWPDRSTITPLMSVDAVGLRLYVSDGRHITAAWSQVVLQPMQSGLPPFIKIRLP